MNRIAVIVPTIPGREASLDRTIASYVTHPGVKIATWPDSPSSGEGWMRGLDKFVELYGEPDYVHFTNDDCELIGDLSGPVVICDAGYLPAPIVYNADNTLQSAGGLLGAPDDLLKRIHPDCTTVGFTTVPFLSWSQWQRIGGLPIHYCSDVWFSERGRQLGIPTVICHGYEIVHHMHQVGRGAGMSQAERTIQDHRIMEAALAQH